MLSETYRIAVIPQPRRYDAHVVDFVVDDRDGGRHGPGCAVRPHSGKSPNADDSVALAVNARRSSVGVLRRCAKTVLEVSNGVIERVLIRSPSVWRADLRQLASL